jgi:hypothetical protein
LARGLIGMIMEKGQRLANGLSWQFSAPWQDGFYTRWFRRTGAVILVLKGKEEVQEAMAMVVGVQGGAEAMMTTRLDHLHLIPRNLHLRDGHLARSRKAGGPDSGLVRWAVQLLDTWQGIEVDGHKKRLARLVQVVRIGSGGTIMRIVGGEETRVDGLRDPVLGPRPDMRAPALDPLHDDKIHELTDVAIASTIQGHR